MEFFSLIFFSFFAALGWVWASKDFEDGETVRGWFYFLLSALNGSQVLLVLL